MLHLMQVLEQKNDCSDSIANIDTTWISDVSTVAFLIRGLSSVSDLVHGSLSISWIGSNVIVNVTSTPASNWNIILAILLEYLQ